MLVIAIGISHLQENSVNFYSIKEQMDTSTDTGMLMFNMMGSIKVEDDEYDISKIPEQCILTDLDNDENEGVPHPYLKLKAKCKGGVYNSKTYER